MADMPLDSGTVIPEGNGRTLGDAGLPDLLPPSIAHDKKMRALAVAKENEMRRFLAKLPGVLIWSAISRLEEPVLTHVAVMLHVDLWDEDWSLGQKRAFLYQQILLHRKKGTTWAVEEAVSLVYGPAEVREWYQYGGEPGCFTLEVDIHEGGLTDALIAKIKLMVEKYKRKSQHLCGLNFSHSTPGTVYYGGTVLFELDITIQLAVDPDIDLPETSSFTASVVDTFVDLTFQTPETGES